MKKILRILLYVAVLVAVFWYARANVNEIHSHEFNLSQGPCIRAILLQVGAYIVYFMTWLALSSRCGARTTVVRAARGWFSSHLAKYIPGKVSTMLIRMDHYPQGTRTGMAIAWVIEGLLVLLGSAAVVLIVGLFKPDTLYADFKIGALFVCLAIMLTQLPPVQAIIMRRIPVQDHTKGQRKQRWLTTVPITGYISGAFIQSLCFIAVIQALHDVTVAQWAPVIIAFHAARFAGIIAFFSPGGIGVQEGVMFLLLENIIPRPVAIVATLLYRLLTLGVEILLCVLMFLFSEGESPGLPQENNEVVSVDGLKL